MVGPLTRRCAYVVRYTIIKSIVYIVLFTWILARYGLSRLDLSTMGKVVEITSIVMSIVSGIWIASALLLLVAISKKDRRYLLPWIITTIGVIGIMVAYSICLGLWSTNFAYLSLLILQLFKLFPLRIVVLFYLNKCEDEVIIILRGVPRESPGPNVTQVECSGPNPVSYPKSPVQDQGDDVPLLDCSEDDDLVTLAKDSDNIA